MSDPSHAGLPRLRLRPLTAVAWLFVACVVVQFFLVGLRAFGVEPWTQVHADFAYLYGWLAPLLVLLAAAGRAPARTQILSIALLVLFAIQTYLPLLRSVAPGIAALHAVNAFVVFWAAVRLAVEASRMPERRGTPLR